jgi:FtsP/CotA-like multicopper oxidase with cupredoxin domain
MKGICGVYALVPACLVLWRVAPARAQTVEVCLRVDQYQIAGPSGTATVGPFGNPAPITMWGFVPTGTGPGCGFAAPPPAAIATQLAIPTLTAVAGNTLVIHLRNNLPPTGTPVYVAPPATVMAVPFSEPVSVIIPGQPSALTPTWTDGTAGARTALGQRVRSFTQETPQQNATAVDYVFGPLKAGTYLLQSGTHPAVQLQMGLYGVLKVLPATVGQAYPDPTSAFDQEVTLLFSEIDPALHTAIGSGLYGPAPAGPTATSPPALLPPGWMTSTIAYHPTYFLINGRPYTSNAAPTTIGATNQRLLFRFLNAGIATKVPLVQGPYFSIIAEDGSFLTASGFTAGQVAVTCPAPRQQYSVLLPAGKVIDAILTAPASPVTIPLYDRRLNLTNNGATPGGMLAILATSAGAASPPAPPPACAIVGGRP